MENYQELIYVEIKFPTMSVEYWEQLMSIALQSAAEEGSQFRGGLTSQQENFLW